MKSVTTDPPSIVAVHEAGHAVAAVLAGGTVIGVALKNTRRGTEGSTSHTMPRLGLLQTLTRNAKIALAGQAARDISVGYTPSRSISFSMLAVVEDCAQGDFTIAVNNVRLLISIESLYRKALQRRTRGDIEEEELVLESVLFEDVDRRCWSLYDAVREDLGRNNAAVCVVAESLLNLCRLSHADLTGIMKASSAATAREMKFRDAEAPLAGHLTFQGCTTGRPLPFSLEDDWEERILPRDSFNAMLKSPLNARRVRGAIPKLLKLGEGRLHAYGRDYGGVFRISLSACMSGCAIDQREEAPVLLTLLGPKKGEYEKQHEN